MWCIGLVHKEICYYNYQPGNLKNGTAFDVMLHGARPTSHISSDAGLRNYYNIFFLCIPLRLFLLINKFKLLAFYFSGINLMMNE